MRSLLPVLGAFLCTGATVLAQTNIPPTALQAVNLLPKEDAKRVARIEARDGKPEPGRWHILVHDPKEETGVHEYVIAGDEIVASRSLSQFVEKLQESDIIGAEAVKIDSDKASKQALQYALANNATVATMDYELMREGDGAAPLWRISCRDEAGKAVGTLVLTASKGTVVSHEGFPLQPVASQEKFAVEASPLVGDGEPAASSETPDATAAVASVATSPAATTSSGAIAEKPAATPRKKTSTTSTKPRSRSSEEDEVNDDRRGPPRFFRRAGGKLQKFFTGRDTISR